MKINRNLVYGGFADRNLQLYLLEVMKFSELLGASN